MRLLIFIGVILIALFVPFWVFLPVAIAYAFWVPAYELILLGAVIDAQFGLGVSHFAYMYLTALALVVLGAELAKPHLVFYRT